MNKDVSKILINLAKYINNNYNKEIINKKSNDKHPKNLNVPNMSPIRRINFNHDLNKQKTIHFSISELQLL